MKPFLSHVKCNSALALPVRRQYHDLMNSDVENQNRSGNNAMRRGAKIVVLIVIVFLTIVVASNAIMSVGEIQPFIYKLF